MGGGPDAQLQPPVDLSTSPWGRRTALLIAALTLGRLVLAGTTELADGEAYYFMWSRFLDWSYYDHPPLIAWMTWLTTRLSEAPLAVRVGPVACATVFAALLYRLAARLFSPRAGFLAVLVVSVLPAFAVTAMVVNPEAPLAPLWVLFLLLLERMRAEDDAWRALAAGAVLGLAFLAKYSGVLLVGVALLYLAIAPGARRWLRRPALYVGGGVALLVALPVVAWNHGHGWPTLVLHFVERRAPAGGQALEQSALQVFANQWTAYHPLLFPGLLFVLGLALWRAREDDRYRFLATAAAPVLGFFFLAMSRVRDPEVHWTMVGYMPLAVAAGGWLDELLDRSRALRRYLAASVAVGGLLGVGGAVHAVSPALVRHAPASLYDPRRDAINEQLGWDQVRDAVRAAAGRLGPGAVVACSQYALCAHVLVTLGDRPPVYCPSERRTQFDFLAGGRHTPPPGAPVVYLNSEHYPDLPGALLPGRDCLPAPSVEIRRGERVVGHYRLWTCTAVGAVASSR